MRHQFIVRADFNDGSLVKHHDHVGLTNGRQTVGDKKNSAVVEVVEKVVANPPFSFVIKSAGGLIHHKQLGIAEQGACDSNPLSLAAAGVLTCAPLFWSLPTAFLSGIAAASGIAVVNSVGNLAGFVSPYMVGALKDMTQSTQLPMYVLSAILVVGALLVWLTPAKLVNR